MQRRYTLNGDETLISNIKHLMTRPALALLISAFVFMACPAISTAAPSAGKPVGLRVSEVRKEGAGLQITYEVKNRTENTVWVYVGNNREEVLPYETRTGLKDKKLLLSSRAPAAMLNSPAEDAVLPRYKAIAPGRTIMFRVELDAEVRDYSPAAGKGEGRLRSGELEVLEVEVGYYAMELDEQEDCCMPAKRSGELYVVPAWASAHPESTVSAVVSKRKRWK